MRAIDLLERGVGHQEARNDAGMHRIGAAELERGRRAIGLGIAGVGGDVRVDLVGRADHRVESREGVVAAQRAAEFVVEAGYWRH